MRVAAKDVTNDWRWFEDYAFTWAEWTVNCPSDRRCEVGMGLMAFGRPRGELREFSGYSEFATIGIGAIHVRVIDGKGPCLVRLDRGKVGLIGVSKPI